MPPKSLQKLLGHASIKTTIYHDIRVRGSSKNQRTFADLANVVCENWSDVTRICETARNFERDIQRLATQPLQPE